MDLIRSARHQIHLTCFILTLDEVGTSILDALEKKARDGVKVRLLLDGFGSFWTFRWRLKSYRRAGGQLAYFLPLFHVPFFGHSNLRNHRKLFVVDQKSAILGGMNLAREYLGPSPDPKRWVDLALLIQGPAAAQFNELFSVDWAFAAHEKIPSEPISPPALSGDETVRIITSGPDVVGDPLYDAILGAVFDARSQVWIATPYFIPDETLLKALELASKRGVEVRVLIPKRSNHRLADLSRDGYIRQLEEAGGRVFHLPERMMHAKCIIIDDRYAIVGSANFDMRSLLLDFELGLRLCSPHTVTHVRRWFHGLIDQSVQVPRARGRMPELLEGLGRVMGPFL